MRGDYASLGVLGCKEEPIAILCRIRADEVDMRGRERLKPPIHAASDGNRRRPAVTGNGSVSQCDCAKMPQLRSVRMARNFLLKGGLDI